MSAFLVSSVRNTDGVPERPQTQAGLGFFSVLFILLILGAGLFLAINRYFLFDSPGKWPLKARTHILEKLEPPASLATPPTLPDISGFTAEAIEQAKPPLKPGAVVVRPMAQTLGFDKFVERARVPEFRTLQGRPEPVALHILSGTYDLPALMEAVRDPAVLSRQGQIYTLHMPLYIEAGATLILAGPPPVEGGYQGRKPPQNQATLRLSQDTGAFLLVSGTLFITDIEIAAWNEKGGHYAGYQKPDRFRPFITIWSGGRSYFSRSRFIDLGYHSSKSYGISFSTSKSFVKANPNIPPPKGWIVQCWFERLYYGFYSYEAEHVAMIHNIYADNIVYAIDPHDRSRYLIIAGNETYGTRKKHGIIVSREVNDSWIFDNVSHSNKGSGFMLDRTSVRNIVANNVAYRNQSDGITLFESEDNILWGNLVYLNKKAGFRIRNSWNVVAGENLVAFNGGAAVELYTQDLFVHEEGRDFILDPFTQRASLTYGGGAFIFNKGGFKTDAFESLTIHDVDSVWYRRGYMRGDFARFGREVAAAVASGAAVVIRLQGGATQETTRKALPPGYVPPEGRDEGE